MDIMYRSRGVSQTAVWKRLIAIIIFLVLTFSMFFIGSAKTKGPAQTVSIGGGPIQTIRLSKDKYSPDEQKVFAVLAITFALLAVAEGCLLGGACVSSTEITWNSIRGNTMGKTVSYPITNITKVSRYGDYIFISGTSGTAVLIVADPARVHELLSKLINR